MTDSPIGGFELLTSGQAGGADRVNKFIYQAASMLSGVTSRLSAPPAHTDGNSYIITTTASDAWVGKEDLIAVSVSGAWAYIEPEEGMRVYVQSEDLSYFYTGSAWRVQRGRVWWPMHAHRSGSQTFTGFKLVDRFTNDYPARMPYDGEITSVSINTRHQNGSDPGDWTGSLRINGTQEDTFAIPWNASSSTDESSADTAISCTWSAGDLFHLQATGPSISTLDISVIVEINWTS